MLGDTNLNPPSRYRTFRDVPQAAVPGQGLVTLVRMDIPSRPLQLSTILSAIAIRIRAKTIITICNIFIHPNEHISPAQISNLIDQLPKPYILLGDYNCRSATWGDETTNANGLDIDQVLLSSDVVILNTGQPTHISIHSGATSCLDLALSSPILCLTLTGW